MQHTVDEWKGMSFRSADSLPPAHLKVRHLPRQREAREMENKQWSASEKAGELIGSLASESLKNLRPHHGVAVWGD